MSQLGIVARIALIVTIALFLGQMAVVTSYMWQSERSPLPPYAIANRIANIVQLLDDTPENLLPRALAVANVNGFRAEITDTVPPGFVDEFSFTRMRVLAQSMLDDYRPGITVRAGAVEGQKEKSNVFTMTFVTQLKSGEFVIFTVSDTTTLRVWNMPIGFLAGFFGIAVALLAILAVARETRPLAQLAQSIDELGNSIEPVEVKERGARELRTLIRAINNMQGRILGLVNNRTLFLGAISHDLKTYLTRFRLRLEIMPASAHKEKAIHDVEAMERLLGDVLLFASESSSANFEAEAIDLNETVGRCVAEMDPEGSRMQISPAVMPLFVRVPPTALTRVIDNLLSNALRYGDHARISTARHGDSAIVTIEDDGPGIRDEDLALVFEPFFRGEPSRNRAHGGTGLGLAIVKQIVEAQGGSIELSNRSNASGLRAMVRLPVANIDGAATTGM
ncbi:ATP-binding protein [Neorhizobium sp. NCHU2750]|uniref:ATP-binding protein n=1 Tax=Neorhizobium sp. NCHU2750 TaxID=1825976 RepID=UPI000E7603E2|nr:hypothetical protein NCHU2750_36090 [Neorhizobium sp. NCHU2750]